MNKLLLIDGTALVFRGFYALPPLKSSTGIPTNAVLGFFNILIQLLIDQSPDYFAICFDRGETTIRKQEYSEYKANRSKAPDELYTQIQIVQNILKNAKLNYIDSPGYEADDLIATLAKQNHDMQTFIYSSDFDLMQLIDENIFVIKPGRGANKNEIIDQEKFQDKYEITPSQVPDYKGLAGDSSDNLPGIPGVGNKTAVKLIHEFKNLENILQNAENLKGALSKKVTENKHLAELSKKLATLDSQVPDTNYKDFNCNNIDYTQLIEDLSELELRNLPGKILKLKKILDEKIIVENQQSLF